MANEYYSSIRSEKMVDLGFTKPEITLLSNQRTSIVTDGISHKLTRSSDGPIYIEDTEGAPELANYGFIKIGDNFELRCKKITITSNREASFAAIGGSGEATASTMPVVCAKNKKNKKTTGQSETSALMGYTIKTLPQFGVYGFVNYNDNDNTDFLYGLTLDKNFYGGDVFDASN